MTLKPLSPRSQSHHRFLKLAKELEQEVIQHRRHLHANPELSFEEFKTAEYIESLLATFGIDSKRIGKTGVVALIGNGEACVALRADIDALPIEEETGLEFRSCKSGVMHACGHDAHTAMLLGAAKILKSLESELQGTVKLIFQPAEEKLPGGASILIAEGVLENPVPRAIFGQHVYPDSKVGTLAFVEGPMMGSADELYWTIRGKGAHAAQPHQGNDVILCASQLVVHLQSIITRLRDPLDPSVLSVTSFHGGFTTNVIPETVELKGTLRSFSEAWRHRALEEIARQSELIAKAHGCIVEFQPLLGYPALHNDPSTTRFAKDVARELLDSESHVTDFIPKMWGEDFAFYAQKIQSTFWMLGVCPLEVEKLPGLHNPRFTPDESAFVFGTAMLVASAVRFLQESE